MKILSIGLDKDALDPVSTLATRLCDYGGLVDKYTVIVPADYDQTVTLSDRVSSIGVSGSCKFMRFVRMFYAAKASLQSDSYEIVTVQDTYYLGLIGVLLKFIYRSKLEIQVHGFEKQYWWRILIAKFCLKQADSIRVVSHRLAAMLVQDFSVSKSKIVSIPVYSSFQKTVHKKSSYLSKVPFVFVTVSRLVLVKNISLQIKAMASLVKIFPNIVLKVIGDGPDYASLNKLVRSLNLQNNIFFLGHIDNVSEHYMSADVFMLTSNAEGWGLVVVEAGSFSLPIIMTDVGCAGEVFINNSSALIIPTGDLEGLVRAMTRLVTDEELRKKLGEGACRVVQGLPSKDEILALYSEAWIKLV